MKSMTGYGCSSAALENIELSIEITSVNRKNLEVVSSLPKDWQALERVILDAVRKKVGRGKVSVYIKAKDLKQAGGITWNDEALKGALEKLKSFSESQMIKFDPTPELIFSIAKSLTNLNELPEPDDIVDRFTEVLNIALDQFSQMRAAEGKSLAVDIKQRLEIMNKHLVRIEEQSSGALPRARELFLERLKKADVPIDLSDERILKEIAIFADKCDVAEEITRLGSHFKQFDEELETVGPIGRKLDFLCQEINRELNTIGSKTNLIDVTRAVIDSKNELERIREQVQNIE